MQPLPLYLLSLQNQVQVWCHNYCLSLMFYCYIISHQCHLLFVPFSRVAWEAVIRYLPRSSSESWSQGWWMNACLHVWIHWEYHLPATLSGRVQAHDKCITLKHSFLNDTPRVYLLHIPVYLFTTFYHNLNLKVRGSKHYIWSCSSTEHTGEVVNITVL